MPGKVQAARSARPATSNTQTRLRVPADLDFAAACARVRHYQPFDGLLRFALPARLVSALRVAARVAIERHGLHGLLNSTGRLAGDYESLSLTYNPNLRDPGIDDVHQSTLGNSDIMPDEYYNDTTHLNRGSRPFRRLADTADTYFDTYGFRLLTPAAQIGALGKFFSECRLSPIRSRLSVLFGDRADQTDFKFGWHRDEPVFENLRINIPLVAH